MSSKHQVQSQAKVLSATSSDAETLTVTQPYGKPKRGEGEPYLDIPFQSAFARASDTFFFSDQSACRHSADHESDRRHSRGLNVPSHLRSPSPSPAPSPSKRWNRRLVDFWAKNKGLALVVISQLFGVMMNVTTRLLEMDSHHGPRLHPFQVCARLAVFNGYNLLNALPRYCLHG